MTPYDHVADERSLQRLKGRLKGTLLLGIQVSSAM